MPNHCDYGGVCGCVGQRTFIWRSVSGRLFEGSAGRVSARKAVRLAEDACIIACNLTVSSKEALFEEGAAKCLRLCANVFECGL